ncbi:hypothetical protein THASP1DRAFT_10460, partial [Thamnocephalis sphaerospora]
ESIDVWLRLHIVLMLVAFGVLFPLGILFGITKHWLHVPTQIAAVAITAVAFVFAHVHGGRSFPESAHARAANVIAVLIAAQVGCGIFLKRFRNVGVLRSVVHGVHRWLGLGWLLLGCVQCWLGLVAYLGFCSADHKGNCLAHEIIGGSFVAYGVAVWLTASGDGRRWLRRASDRSTDWADALLVTFWGMFNTLTEHPWGQASWHFDAWNHTDMQHTSMGVLWLAGGAAALATLARWPAQRTPLPALVILFTGGGMVAHHQHHKAGVMTHAWFGRTLMAAAVLRIIEIMLEEGNLGYHMDQCGILVAFRRLSALLMVIAGILFCGSTEQAVEVMATNDIDLVTYMNGLISVAFGIALYVELLVAVY